MVSMLCLSIVATSVCLCYETTGLENEKIEGFKVPSIAGMRNYLLIVVHLCALTLE